MNFNKKIYMFECEHKTTTTIEEIQKELDKVSNDLEVAIDMEVREELKFQLVLELSDKKCKLIKELHKAIDDKYL